jgi:hypothetical protein
MSQLTLRNLQLGLSTTPGDNFHLRTLAPAGSLRLSRGNVGAPTQDILNVSPAGVLTFSQPIVPANDLGGMRNRLLNGAINVNQRALGSRDTGGYLVDRWLLGFGGFAPRLGSAADYSTSAGNPRHMYLQCLTARPAPAATDFCIVSQRVEGFYFQDARWGQASAKPVVLSFRAAASVAGQVIGVFVRNATSTRSFVSAVTLAAGANDYSVAIPGCTDGTWEVTGLTGAEVGFCTGIGTTYRAPANDVWLPSNYVGALGQSNGHLTVGQYVNFAQLQLEVGTTARTAFEFRPAPPEEALCQRYYEVIQGVATNARLAYTAYPFKANKRVSNGAVSVIGGSLTGANYTTAFGTLFCPDSVLSTGGTSGWTIAIDAEL